MTNKRFPYWNRRRPIRNRSAESADHKMSWNKSDSNASQWKTKTNINNWSSRFGLPFLCSTRPIAARLLIKSWTIYDTHIRAIRSNCVCSLAQCWFRSLFVVYTIYIFKTSITIIVEQTGISARQTRHRGTPHAMSTAHSLAVSNVRPDRTTCALFTRISYVMRAVVCDAAGPYHLNGCYEIHETIIKFNVR